MGTISLTKFPVLLPATVNNTIRVRWRKKSDPDVDASYTGAPDALVNESGTIITPYPYEITVPDTIIVVEAMTVCDGVKFTKEFTMCGLLSGLSASIAGGCAEGYTLSPDGTSCSKVETMAPVITATGCFAKNQNANYASQNARIYSPGFPNVMTNGNFATYVNQSLAAQPLWKNSSATNGPMNTDALWFDNNCNGVADALPAGTKITIAFTYNNTGVQRQMYIGLGGDNVFAFTLNDLLIASNNSSSDSFAFTGWNLFPITVRNGMNYFNVVGTGDGSVQDALAVVLYDNTQAQLAAATTEGQLNILYKSRDLIGGSTNVATCADGWSLDTSGGTGNYVCKRTSTQPPNAATITYAFTPDVSYVGDITLNIYAADGTTFIGSKKITIAGPGQVNGTIVVPALASYVLKYNADVCADKQLGSIPVTPPTPTCAAPTNLVVDGITATGAIAHWTAATTSPSGGYLVTRFKYQNGSYVQDAQQTVGSGTSVNYVDLVGGTMYRVSVWSICSGSNSGILTVDFVTPGSGTLYFRNKGTNYWPGSTVMGYFTIGSTTYSSSIIALTGEQKGFVIVPGTLTVKFSVEMGQAGKTLVVKLLRGGTTMTQQSMTSVSTDNWFTFTYAFQDGDVLELQPF